MTSMLAYKVTTHDLRPPVQGGDPIWDGSLPFVLPVREADHSAKEYGKGWNACADPAIALRIVGLWMNGWPSRLWRVETDAPVTVFGDNLRAATWTILEEAPITDEILADLHRPLASDGLPLDELVREVQAWRLALARPEYDEAIVEAGLTDALKARGLPWELRRYETDEIAWDIWDACDGRDINGVWGAIGARDVFYVKSASDCKGVFGAWDAIGRREIPGTWGAIASGNALMHYVSVKRGWLSGDAMQYTVGIRDAYRHGMALALPTERNELGWAMVAKSDDDVESLEDKVRRVVNTAINVALNLIDRGMPTHMIEKYFEMLTLNFDITEKEVFILEAEQGIKIDANLPHDKKEKFKQILKSRLLDRVKELMDEGLK